MAWLFTPGDETKIERALRASPVRAYLAVVPLSTDDDDALAASYYLDQLYRRMHRPGVYLAVGPSGSIYDAEYLVPRDITLPASVEEESVFDSPGPIASNAPGRILTVLHLIATAPADPQQAVSPTPLYTPGEFSDTGSSSGSPSAAGPIATAGIVSFLFGGPLLALAGFGLVRHARGELAALGRLIAAGNDMNPGWSRACDDYDAGMLVLTPTAEPIDLAAAIVLARDGRLALAWETAAPPPLCLVNPLHGRSVSVLPGAGDAGARVRRAFRPDAVRARGAGVRRLCPGRPPG